MSAKTYEGKLVAPALSLWYDAGSMSWGRFIWAVVAGSLGTAMAIMSADDQVIGWIQGPIKQVLPAAFPRGLRSLLTNGTTYMILALPGVIFATYIASRRARTPETHCRRCGYILRGLAEPRCPACEEPI